MPTATKRVLSVLALVGVSMGVVGSAWGQDLEWTVSPINGYLYAVTQDDGTWTDAGSKQFGATIEVKQPGRIDREDEGNDRSHTIGQKAHELKKVREVRGWLKSA